MKKLKQYNIALMIRGKQLRAMIVSTSYKAASDSFDISKHQLITYGGLGEPKSKHCIENPYTVFCYPDSGELITHDATNRNKVMRKDQWDQYISDFNKKKYAQFNKSLNVKL